MGRKYALAILSVTALCVGAVRFAAVRMGRQPDGSFVVSTGQRVEAGGLSFNGRPIDFAVHPTEALFAVLNKNYVFLATTDRVLPARVSHSGPTRDSGALHGRPTGPSSSPAPSKVTSRPSGIDRRH